MPGGPFGFKTARFGSAIRDKSFCPRRFYQTVVPTKEPIAIPRLTQIVRVKGGQGRLTFVNSVEHAHHSEERTQMELFRLKSRWWGKIER